MTTENEDSFITKFPPHIQRRIDKGMGCSSGIGKGWLGIVLEADKKLNEINNNYAIDQIKEKFGLLRISISGIDYDKAGKILEAAEEKSGEICELCGEKGKLRNRDWKVTLCNKHNEQY